MNNNIPFVYRMSLRERIGGIIYIPIHCCVLPLLLAIADMVIFNSTGTELNSLTVNFVIYSIGCLFCFIFMWKYLKASFGDIFDAPGKFIKTAIGSLCINYFISIIVASVIMVVMENGSGSVINPNTEDAGVLIHQDFNTAAIMTVIFAPIVEECMFRGALFGTIRTKSRFWAYAVTAAAFSIYHLWAYFLTDYSWELWIYLLQYAPISIILCRAYEKSGTVWCPIVIHSVINLIATNATKMLT